MVCAYIDVCHGGRFQCIGLANRIILFISHVFISMAWHVRTELSRRMHIRRSPELLFIEDDGSAYAAHINELIKGLEDE